MLKNALTDITLAAFFALTLLGCEKNKIECDTDAECEQMLIGLWEQKYHFYEGAGSTKNTRYEFLKSGIFKVYGYSVDSTGNSRWVEEDDPNVSYDDTFYYSYRHPKLIVRYGGAGKYKDSVYLIRKVQGLTEDILNFKEGKKFKRVK